MAAASLAFISPKDVTLGNLLGTGGFGEVFKAHHVNWGTVAVKQLKGVTLTDSIKKEAEKMWRVITSPYLVTIMGIVQDPAGLGIVMEYFENGSLKDFQQKYMKCDCWSRKVKMIKDVAFGMNYLHTLTPPIIHRDLKVENLFVGDGFEAKIGDLGLAVSSDISRQVSQISGTRSHIPPEATTNPLIEPDESWDIYTFAITTYELTSGKDAWPQQKKFANDALVSVWVANGHRPNLEAIPAEAPEEIVDVIKQCWVAEPKGRPRFQEIVKTVTELFEKKYRSGIRKADRAILEQMDLVHESTKESDSDVDSFWGKFEAIDINDTDTSKGATSTESSIALPTECRIVLVGRVGEGKSATANTIFGYRVFEAKACAGAVTTECQYHKDTIEGRHLLIVDTPGIFDTRRNNSEFVSLILQFIGITSPGPHVILHVMKLGLYNSEVTEVQKLIRDMLGNESYQYTILVLTGGDYLEEDDIAIEEYLLRAPSCVKQMLHECGHRYVVFNNRLGKEDRRAKAAQLTDLFRQIDDVIKVNHGGWYRSAGYKAAVRNLREKEAIISKTKRLLRPNLKDILDM